jgi:hypothetical protein
MWFLIGNLLHCYYFLIELRMSRICNTLIYRTIANDLRKVLRKERHKGWKLVKGSFFSQNLTKIICYRSIDQGVILDILSSILYQR